jgi:hypothetical protein
VDSHHIHHHYTEDYNSHTMANRHREYLSIRLPMDEATHQALRVAAAKHRLSKGLALVEMAQVWLTEHGYLPAGEASEEDNNGR